MSIRKKLQDPSLPSEERDKIIGSFVRRQENERLRERYAQRLQQQHGVERTGPTVKRGVRPINLKFLLAIAASLLLALSIFLLYPGPDENTLLAEYLDKESIFVPVDRSVIEPDEAGAQVRRQLMEAFGREDYPTVIASARQLTELDNTLNYLLAHSYLATDDYPAALNTFQQITSGNDYVEESTWYTRLLLLKTGERAAALRGLNAYQPTDYYYPQAQRLLNTAE